MPRKTTEEASFFEKLYLRILSNPTYNTSIEWREDGHLLIYDVKAFEEAISTLGICLAGVSYDSIARQLRIYGFNRVVSKQLMVKSSREVVKLWKHTSLTSTCRLDQVQQFQRLAPRKPSRPKTVLKQKQQQRKKTPVAMHAAENSPDGNEHSHIQINEEPHDDDDNDLAVCTVNNMSEESSDPAEMEVQPSEQYNNPTPMVPAFYDPTAQSYTVDVTDAASIASESNCDPRDTPTHLHTDFWRWLHAPTVEAGSSEAVADGEVSSGSSFDEAMDDTMALQPKSSSTEEEFGNLFTFANGGIFAGRD